MAKKKAKRLKPRLPIEAVQKLTENTGGGTHTKKKGKGSFSRKAKHAKRDSGNDSSDHFPLYLRSSLRWWSQWRTFLKLLVGLCVRYFCACNPACSIWVGYLGNPSFIEMGQFAH